MTMVDWEPPTPPAGEPMRAKWDRAKWTRVSELIEKPDG